MSGLVRARWDEQITGVALSEMPVGRTGHSNHLFHDPALQQVPSPLSRLKLSQTKRQDFARIAILISVDPDESLCLLIHAVLEGNDDELEVCVCVLGNVLCNLVDVVVVKSGINLVENEERCGLVATMPAKREDQRLQSHYTTPIRSPYLCIARRSAKAATVFSPPESCSISRNRLLGGMAWYLTPLRYGSSLSSRLK